MLWLPFALGLAAVIAYLFKCVYDFATRLQTELKQPIEVVLEDPDNLKPVPVPSIFGNPTKTLSLIVPAYNEEDRLGATMDETLSYLQRRRDKEGPHFTYEIIIVDDGSTDKTVRVGFDYVRKYGFDTVRVLRVTKNKGKGHAVKRGMLIARGETCLLMDADGATRVTDLEKLEEALAKTATAGTAAAGQRACSVSSASLSQLLGVVVGSRSHLAKAASVKRTWIRNFLMHGFHLLVMFVAGPQIKDTQCGFKLFTRRAAAILFSNQHLQRWCFDVELIYLAHALGIPVVEVNVNWTEMPGSKIKFTSILHMAFEMLTVKVSYQMKLWNVSGEGQLVKQQ